MQHRLSFAVLWMIAHSVVGPFYWGSAPFSENEMSELNGRMTPRKVSCRYIANLEKRTMIKVDFHY